jgi:glycosyltransferase involved in cell wall biosynthesis
MKVVYVTHQYPPRYTTGTELYAKRLALKIRGSFAHDVRVFTYEPSYAASPELARREETVDDGVAVTRVYAWSGLQPNFSLGRYYNAQLGKMFGLYLDQVRPSVVHFFHTAFLGASTIEEARLRGIATVVNLMDYWYLCPTTQLLRTRTLEDCTGPEAFKCLECLSVGDSDFDKLLAFTRGDGFTPVSSENAVLGNGLRFSGAGEHNALAALNVRQEWLRQIVLTADRIVSPSATVRDRFIAAGYPEHRIEIVPYGVEPMPSYTFDKGHSPTMRFGFIGSINRPKGLHVLVEAMRRVRGDCSLDIYGNPAHFPQYAESCFETARHDSRIRIRGPVKPEHVATALRDLDALVVPSLWSENTPFVVLEGRAAGIPIVASQVGGIAEIVEEGHTGRLFRAGDVDHLSVVMQELVDNRDMARRLTGNFAGVRTLLANARQFTEIYDGTARRSAPVAMGDVS